MASTKQQICAGVNSSSGVRRAWFAAGLAAALYGLGLGAFESEAAQVRPAWETQAGTPQHQSTFVSDPTFGKDPFFPNSKRRLGLPAPRATVSVVPDVNPTGEPQWDLLNLRGISLAATRKLAMINHYTFAEGEEMDVKVANQVVKVRCVSIKERSVVISVKGRTREIKLRDGL